MPAQNSTSWTWPLLGLVLAICAGTIAFLYVQPAVDLRGQDPAATNASGESVKPLLEGWPVPAAAIVLSGEMKGYIEPCGCTEGQYGGLARRATLIRRLKEERQWNVIGLELGGTSMTERVGRLQTDMKFEFARDALEQLGYVSLGLGYDEVLQRQDKLLEIADRANNKDDYGLRLLSANVLPYPDTPELEITRRYQIIEVPATANGRPPVRIAVTSILGESMSKGIVGDDFLRIAPPAEALQEVVPQMQAERPDLMVLLSNAKTDESKQLAQAFPAFQVVVSAGGIEEGMLQPERIGGTTFLQVGQKGKQVGVLGYYPGTQQPLRFENVKLGGDRFDNAPELEQMMRVYQTRLENERPDLFDNQNPPQHPSGATFVGAETCGECHSGSFEKWKSTGHAKAARQPGVRPPQLSGSLGRSHLGCRVHRLPRRRLGPATGSSLGLRLHRHGADAPSRPQPMRELSRPGKSPRRTRERLRQRSRADR
ncbi:MAG: hypothetical protein R3B90_11090 [Planctomycetaceae bacterium]